MLNQALVVYFMYFILGRNVSSAPKIGHVALFTPLILGCSWDHCPNIDPTTRTHGFIDRFSQFNGQELLGVKQ